MITVVIKTEDTIRYPLFLYAQFSDMEILGLQVLYTSNMKKCANVSGSGTISCATHHLTVSAKLPAR